uniref:Uncharacterized protein n=1 Tax=Lactuca sativa TaxID=4236 RepID=A0A9R1VNF1_LACSA|nr:hypothetical protein LSAT_V11C500262980 [Lactuca sativa]
MLIRFRNRLYSQDNDKQVPLPAFGEDGAFLESRLYLLLLLMLKLIGTRENDGRQHNLPTTNEVATLIIGDIDGSDSRDIILET